MASKLERGIEQIVESFQEFQQEKQIETESLKAERDELLAENEKLRSKIDVEESQRGEIKRLNQDLINKNSILDAKVAELEHILGLLQQENDLIAGNFNDMSQKYNALQVFANDLERFQKVRDL